MKPTKPDPELEVWVNIEEEGEKFDPRFFYKVLFIIGVLMAVSYFPAQAFGVLLAFIFLAVIEK